MFLILTLFQDCPRVSKMRPGNPPGTRYYYRCVFPLIIESSVDREKRVEKVRKPLERLYGSLKKHPDLLRERVGSLSAPATRNSLYLIFSSLRRLYSTFSSRRSSASILPRSSPF